MLSKVVFVAILSVACAASVAVEKQGQVAQARDTHGGGGGHGGHGGHGGGGGSSYAAPAPAAGGYDEGGSQGNLYYYYYPVSESDPYEVSDGGFDIFAAIILPLLILGGILLLLSSLTFTLTTQRALSDDPLQSSFMDQLHDEIERVFYVYLNAFESEQCLQRTICEMGAYSKDFKGKEFVLDLVEPLVPEGMKTNMAIFKKAASSGYETGKCKKFRCVAPKLL